MSPAVFTAPRWARLTPLGVRFRDELSGRFIDDGLQLWAWPAAQPERRLPGRKNRSFVYLFDRLPGLRAAEDGNGDDDFWAAVARRPFTIEVTDTAERFLGFRFTADLPHRGLYALEESADASPPAIAGNQAVPLFSAPARPVLPARAVLRADLWDAQHDRPASFALLSAEVISLRPGPHTVARALADVNGRVALQLGCPDVDDLDGGSFDSPPGPAGMPLATRTWQVTLRAAYAALPLPSIGFAGPRLGEVPIPDLRAALGQGPANLWSDDALTMPLTRVTATYAQEQILRSHASATGRPLSRLLLTQTSSPP